MMTVYKYQFEIKDQFDIDMPSSEHTRILHVAVQNGIPCIWALVEPAYGKWPRSFRLVGTGHPIEGCVGEYVGTFFQADGALVPACTLCATEKWTDEDRKNMEPHVMDGFRMLRDRFDFTAHVIVWHHRFQSSGYPAELPAALQPFSEETLERAKDYGKLLMIADVFDAMHRVNSGSGGVALTDGQIEEQMLKLHPELLGGLVSRLYEKGVLR